MTLKKIRRSAVKFLNTKSKDIAGMRSKEAKANLAKLEKACATKAEEAKIPYTEAKSTHAKAIKILDSATVQLTETENAYDKVVRINAQKLSEARNLVKVTMEHEGIRSAIAKSLSGLANIIK